VTHQFQHLQRVPVLKTIPVPILTPWLDGLDMTKYSESTGQSSDDIYFLGEVRKVPAKPFYAYYIVLGFYKEAIPILMLFVVGACYLWSRKSFVLFWRDEALYFYSSPCW
jgi:hypothetical protein